MRTRRRNAIGPRDDVPYDRAHEGAEYYIVVHHIGGNDPGADRLRHMGAEDQECGEIEKGRPDDGRLRSQYARRYDGRNRIGGVMQSDEEIEYELEQEQGE